MNTLERKVDALVRLCISEDEAEKKFIIDSLRRMCNYNAEKKVDYSTRISDALLELGTPDRVLGHKYLISAIKMVIDNSDIVLQVTRDIYPKIATEFDTTPNRVERAIRHAIEATWDRADFIVIDKYFGNTVSPVRGKPTNSEFIQRMANALR